jgi:hypothetical protein
MRRRRRGKHQAKKKDGNGSRQGTDWNKGLMTQDCVRPESTHWPSNNRASPNITMMIAEDYGSLHITF